MPVDCYLRDPLHVAEVGKDAFGELAVKSPSATLRAWTSEAKLIGESKCRKEGAVTPLPLDYVRGCVENLPWARGEDCALLCRGVCLRRSRGPHP